MMNFSLIFSENNYFLGFFFFVLSRKNTVFRIMENLPLGLSSLILQNALLSTLAQGNYSNQANSNRVVDTIW